MSSRKNMAGWSPSRVMNMRQQQQDYSPSRYGRQSNLSLLDTFDPYDARHQIMHQPQLNWINRPDQVHQQVARQPDVPHRYRIALDCRGFKPESLKCEFKEGKQPGQHVLRICGLEESGKKGSDSFKRHELHRCFTLPANIDIHKMVSFVTADGKLIVEFPLRGGKKDNIAAGGAAIGTSTSPVRQMRQRTPVKSTMSSMSPTRCFSPTTRVQGATSPYRFGGASSSPARFGGVEGKQLKIRLPLPENISPEKIHVSIKDGDLIMRCEDTNVSKDEATSIHVFLRYTLPNNIDVNSLKCVKEDGHLLVTAPVNIKPYGGKQHMQQQQPGGMFIGGQKQQQLGENLLGESKKAAKKKNKNKALGTNILSI
jgi:HSP20 family molecular chaperone IbpA